MTRMVRWLAAGAWLSVALGGCFGQATTDVILKAMKDELERGKALRVIGDPPFFIEYALDDGEVYTLATTYGSVISERQTRLRQPRVRIRVGDPKLDNSNHIFSDAYRGSRYDPSQLVLDDSYDNLRISFWLATDRAYKQSLEALARKKASLKNITVTENLPDFVPAEAVRHLDPSARKPISAEPLRRVALEASGLFGAFPKVLASEVTVGISNSLSYLVNTEGSEVRFPENLTDLRVRASGLASDGTVIRDSAEFLAFDPARLPGEAEIKAAAKKVAENVTALADAEVLDNYVGPMLFEDIAGPQVLAQLLARNLKVTRRPVTDPERPLNIPSGEFEGRQGSRILPDWMDVVDDPTQKEWQGRPLLGYYPVDVEGVTPKALSLVERGVLKTFYATRQPVAGVGGSNGHARLPGSLGNNHAAAGNVFVKTNQIQSSENLRKQLLDMGKQRNKPFVIVVRKLDFPSTASLDELRRIGSGAQGRIVSRPLLAYKVYPDGKEELIRGVRFRNLSPRALKDIVAASDQPVLFHYLENNAPFAHMDGGGYVAGTSIVAPSLLFDEVELEKIPGELPNLPLVPPPPLTQ